MIESNPLYGKAWIEPHLFWLGILSLVICFVALRFADKRERRWAEEDEEEMRKHENFKRAMDKE